MPAKSNKPTKAQAFRAKAKTRLLIHLWYEGGYEKEIKKADLNKAGVVRSQEQYRDYDKIYRELDKLGAIKLYKEKKPYSCRLTHKGLQLIDEGIKSADFRFERNVSSKFINAVLIWFTQPNYGYWVTHDGPKIGTYNEFQSVVLVTCETLTEEQDAENVLVPIYQIRRKIGDRVTREEFDEWLLEMQSNDIVELQGDSLPDSEPDQIEDSIKTESSGLCCYAKVL